MQKRPITILGVNPGAKYLGIAVFRGPELRDWRMKVTKGKWSDSKYRRIIEILAAVIERHRPDVIALKRLHPSRSSTGLDRLVQKIIAFAEKKKMKIYRYGIKEMEAFFAVEGKRNKRKMAEVIASEYPALHGELNLEKGIKNSYYLRMFEAVALGSICLHETEGANLSIEKRTGMRMKSHGIS